MSCKRGGCDTRCQGKGTVDVQVIPEILCSGPQQHHLDFPVNLDVEIVPRCSLKKVGCGDTQHNCKTRCNYVLSVDLDVIPKMGCPSPARCIKDFTFSAATRYIAKCGETRGNACDESSSSNKPARKPARKSGGCGTGVCRR
jgi:hypothetical protein